jgi:hypothetical protein
MTCALTMFVNPAQAADPGIITHSEIDGLKPVHTFRNRIGMEVALEALRDGLRPKKATLNETQPFARAARYITDWQICVQ